MYCHVRTCDKHDSIALFDTVSVKLIEILHIDEGE